MKNNNSDLYRKTIFSTLMLLLMFCFCSTIQAQPQYFNYNTTGSANSFPFNIAGGKDVQLLYLPGDFNQPTPAPAGNITSISFRIHDSYPLGPWTYTDLTIKLGQSSITSFDPGTFYAGSLTTVYYRASVLLTGAAGGWMTIVLDNPFLYNPAQSLIVDVSQCAAPGATGFSSCFTTLTDNRRNWSVAGCPFVYSNQNSAVVHLGLDINTNFVCTSGVGCQMPDLINGYASDRDYPQTLAEGFVPTAGTITSVCWYGLYYNSSSFTDCSPGPGDFFEITYFDNNGGVPGNIIAGPFAVIPNKGITGNMVSGGYVEYGYECTHPPVSVIPYQGYWIRITNNIPGTCEWGWETAPAGDASIYWFEGGGIIGGDLAFCLDVPINPNGILTAAPINDVCQNAIPLTIDTTFIGTTTNATNQDYPPDCITTLGSSPGVWYTLMGTGGTININTCGAGTTYDTKIGVFTGSCGTFTCITGNDDFCGLHSQVEFCSVLGVQYYIYVTGYGGASGDFELAITHGIIAPVINTCPANINQNNDAGACAANVTIPVPLYGVDFSDDCSATITNDYTGTDNASGLYPLGITLVKWTAIDGDGNKDSCNQQITVVDIDPPTLNCPSDIVQSNDVGSCDAVVNYTAPIGIDNCPNVNIHLTQSVDQTTITGGNSVSCHSGAGHANNAYLRVYDLPALGILDLNVVSVDFGIESAVSLVGKQPVTVNLYSLSGPLLYANMTLIATQNDSVPDTASAIYTVPIITSVPAGSVLVVELYTPDGQTDGNMFYIGSNANGQTDTSYIAAADCGIVEPMDIAAVCCPNVHIILNLNATDSTTTQLISGLGSGATFPIGTTTETYQSTDAYGNTNVCSFDVTVNDDELPLITCPADINVPVDAGLCTASGVALGTATTSDNCGVSLVVNDATEPYITGNNIVTWTVTDIHGNTDTCTQIVSVGENIDPTITCPSDTIIYTPSTTGTTFNYSVTGSDNCILDTTYLTAGLVSGSTFPIGVTTNSWVAIDNSGNSNTCSFTVTVISTFGIDESVEGSVGLYPNPTNGKLTIMLSEGYEGTLIYLYSAEGKLIRLLGESTKKRKIECDLSDVADGLYYLKFENNKTTFYKKVIKN
jgi:hypothetical protein